MTVTTHFPLLTRLLANNAQWASDVDQAQPGFHLDCAKGQAPKVLWIGCADSRVPESVVLACKPGDVFVHRNIANQFHPNDDNALSVLTYAVEDLGVEHVIIVGHTQCGGAAACYAAASSPSPLLSADAPLGRWLEPLTDIARALPPADRYTTMRALVESNVRQQVENVVDTSIMKDVWNSGREVYVHGWVYEIEKGKLRDLGISVCKAAA